MTAARPLPEYCVRGHCYADHLRHTPKGWRYCDACCRENWDRRYAAQHDGCTIHTFPSGHRRCLDCPRPAYADAAAIERAIAGDAPPRLNPAEREAAVLKLRTRGISAELTAELVGCTVRTVWRIQARNRQTNHRSAA